MFSIGEFSRITGLTIKTLRFYHEQGLLIPTHVDDETGYRYYAASLIERARAIALLRELDFSLGEIREILAGSQDEADLLEIMQRHRDQIEARIQSCREVVITLNRFIADQQEARLLMASATSKIEEKNLPALLIAGVRMVGKYSDCGPAFAKIGRKFGRHIRGKPLLLHYSQEYRENDADFEACMPIKTGKPVDGISVRELPGGRCVSLIHKGPYNELGRSYAKILEYIHEKGYEVATPSREVYLKGPGMIFKGNPKNYLTEIQMFISEAGMAATS